MKSNQIRPFPFAVALALLCACHDTSMTVRSEPGRWHVFADGEAFATVHVGAEPRPYVWPLFAPGGVAVTRDHPMGERDGEAHDHPHHQSLWFAHGAVDGFDFWHGRDHAERMELLETFARIDHDEHVVVHASYRWLVDDDTVVLHEQRMLRFEDHGDWRSVDVVTELRPAGESVTFGDTKEGSMAVRVHPQLRHEGKVATGRLSNSEGHFGKVAWGKRARWIDDSGTIDGEPIGIAMFDHPDNPRHPTWWHARSYGLLAANPFGAHDFEKQPKGAGDLVVRREQPLVLHYRIVLHPGWDGERIERAYRDWAVPRAGDRAPR